MPINGVGCIMPGDNMNREDVVKKLEEICKEYSDILGTVILFGSYSRGEATERSDIDLYIEPRDKSVTTKKMYKNKRYYEFKCTLYDTFPCEFDLLVYGGKRDLALVKKSRLWGQIEKDGVTLL